MSTKVNKTVIGIFMVSAVALLVAGVVILGSGKFFKHRPTYVMFFGGSVQGLTGRLARGLPGREVGEVNGYQLGLTPLRTCPSVFPSSWNWARARSKR